MSKTVRVSCIVAMACNGVIGKDNQLPWRIPGELQYFKKVTLGKPVIMGRKTCESLRGPLPGRRNIVVSRSDTFSREGFDVCATPEAALSLAKHIAEETQQSEVMVIGGAQLYQYYLDQTDRMYITEIHREYEGDAVFPLAPSKYPEKWDVFKRDPQHVEDHRFDYVVYDRKNCSEHSVKSAEALSI